MSNNEGEILVINSGSSSLKFGIYVLDGNEESLRINGSIDSIGTGGGKLKLKDGNGQSLAEQNSDAKTLEDAFKSVIDALSLADVGTPIAIGHRIVHGGPHLREHQKLTPKVLSTLKQATHFAPLHDPPAIAIIEAAQKQFKQVPQFVCFDTAFHKTLPEIAAHYALPLKYWEQGVLRYGFHGLSYESIVRALGDRLPSRIVAAHLGNGASLAAILDGKSVDTSMGLTPTGGIPMGTRSGDLDPGIVLWLLRSGLNVDQVESLLNRDGGLKALSNGESDLRALSKASAAGDAAAKLAIDIFTRSIAKTIASYAVSLGGLDLLVLTGGIGENSAPVRQQVCSQLEFLGTAIDEAKNVANAELISAGSSKIDVKIIAADEDGQIARHTRRLLVS
jgi:acetate kinase